MKFKAQILDETAFIRTVTRLAHQIIENTKTAEQLCLIGIKTRGAPLAERLAANIARIEGVHVPTGTLDITLYRDDLSRTRAEAHVQGTDIAFSIEGKTVVLVDDVIFTGRTARAAMEAVIRLGRPARIQLLAMIDRGHRELPIRPDYVGKNIPTSQKEVVAVCLPETDGKTGVDLYELEN